MIAGVDRSGQEQLAHGSDLFAGQLMLNAYHAPSTRITPALEHLR